MTRLIILLLFSIFGVFYIVSATLGIFNVRPTTTKGVSRNPKRIPRNDYQPLLVFIQITDLHLSIYHDPQRIKDFQDFCNRTLDAVKPAVVLVSGDLTDAKYEDAVRTRQFKEEWEMYRKALDDNNILNKTIWLDLRGNHDSFNSPLMSTTKNSYFAKYSIQGQHHNKSYMYTFSPFNEKHSLYPSAKYSFIAVDAALDPGPKAPWNFIGQITEDEMKLLVEYEEKTRDHDGRIWFGHYPTSCIVSQHSIRELIGDSSAYLCGHLHTIYGAVKKMYTKQHSGMLELELADFKDNRMYRIGAFDHGVFSFKDVKHGDWPIILLTNPKNPMFKTKMDLTAARLSTHIRILVFSTSKVISVKLRINDGPWIECKSVEGPLFVTKWNPLMYQKNVHFITIVAKDESGQVSEINQEFSLEENFDSTFHFLARFVLMINAATASYGIFLIVSISSVMPLVLAKCFKILIKGPLCRWYCSSVLFRCFSLFQVQSIFRKIWITTTINRIFWPLIISPIYLTVGPWYIGELIDSHTGFAFAWGTFVQNTWLPGAFSYSFDGCIHLTWFYMPFMLVLSHCVDLKFQKLCWSTDRRHISNLDCHIPMILLIISQLVIATLFYLSTGLTFLFLGSLRLYSFFLGLTLWFFLFKLKQSSFRPAYRIWKNQTTMEDNAFMNGFFGFKEFSLLSTTVLEGGPAGDDDDEDHHHIS